MELRGLRGILLMLALIFPVGVNADLICVKIRQQYEGRPRRLVIRQYHRESKCPAGFKLLLNIDRLKEDIIDSLPEGSENVEGSEGPRGEVGPQGLQGERGERGDPGLQGVAGDTGVQGSTGLAGAAGSQGPQGDTGLTGATGAQGTQGIDGAIRIYGDASAGDMQISSNTDWDTDSGPTNLQFDNFTINSSVNLTVPSGTVIRCSGDFLNQGTITVSAASEGGKIFHNDAYSESISSRLAVPSVFGKVPYNGKIISTAQYIGGGDGADGVSKFRAATVFPPAATAGSGGGAGYGAGGAGGGFVTVIVAGSIINSGAVIANGAAGIAGGGGGGGGIVILASLSSVSQSGTVRARGGDGGSTSSTNNAAAGGGGGGGIIHIISPVVTGSGSYQTDGGFAGSNPISISGGSSLFFDGGGGGSCGGDGGSGGYITGGGSPVALMTGRSAAGGDEIITIADPTSLF